MTQRTQQPQIVIDANPTPNRQELLNLTADLKAVLKEAIEALSQNTRKLQP